MGPEHRRRRGILYMAAAAVVCGLLPAGGSVRAQTTYVIGIDNASPPGHNFQYVDYFPRNSLSVLSGDVVDFKWNTGSPDGFHTAFLVKTGETVAQAYAANPLVTPDADDGAGALTENFGAFAPTNPPPGAGPTGCGDATTPCTFDGTSDLNSGANPTAPGADFFVKITAGVGTYNFLCLVHPGMVGSLSVVASGASNPADVANAAAAQYSADTTGALAAEAAASSAAVTVNANGTRTWTMTAGTATDFVEVVEMLPQSLRIAPGDTVTWKTKTIKDIHTVTFPQGPGSDVVDPFLPPVCESATGDTPAPANAGPPNFGCSGAPGSATGAEFPVDPGPHGGTVIPNQITPATSGILSNPPAPFPSSYSYTFPNAGGFRYQCRIHDHMTGLIVSSPGYYEVASDGGIFSFQTGFDGSMGGKPLNKPIVGMSATPTGDGYWMVASDGGIFSFGFAGFFGSMGGKPLNKPMVGMAAGPGGNGYWTVASDGGVFSFGTPFWGSEGAKPLNKPIVTMMPTSDGGGYWLVASDGGIFAFGDADYFGSMGGRPLNAPIVGMAATPDDGGYWLVASDGGIFAFGDAAFHGSMGGKPLNKPVVGMAATKDGSGYWLDASDGGIFAFNAPFLGSMGGKPLNKPMVGMAAV